MVALVGVVMVGFACGGSNHYYYCYHHCNGCGCMDKLYCNVCVCVQRIYVFVCGCAWMCLDTSACFPARMGVCVCVCLCEACVLPNHSSAVCANPKLGTNHRRM